MGIRKTLKDFIHDLKFFLLIYTWTETWIIVAVGISVTGVWFVIAYALSLPNPLRSIVVWVVVILFSILVPKALTSIPKKDD